MKPKKRQKLCPNCEGEVDLEVIVCPFCAADLRLERLEPLPPRESLPKVEVAPNRSFAWPKGPLLTLVLLGAGAQLFLLAFFQLLFSSSGWLVLKWDARFWFLYLFASIPLLVLGGKRLSEGKDEAE
jgi:hypothetical protein